MEVRISGDIEPVAGDLDLYTEIVRWTCRSIKLQPESIDVIIVDDDTLRELHKIYLHDDTKTDVMTFNLGENGVIEGEIYISLPRAQEQSEDFNVPLREELIRLIIHALLHLAGYDDQNDQQLEQMKESEDKLVREAKNEFLKV